MINSQIILIDLGKNLYCMSLLRSRLSSIDKKIFTEAYHTFASYETTPEEIRVAKQNISRRVEILYGAQPTLLERIKGIWAWFVMSFNLFGNSQSEFEQSLKSLPEERRDLREAIRKKVQFLTDSRLPEDERENYIKLAKNLLNWNGTSIINYSIPPILNDLYRQAFLLAAKLLPDSKEPPLEFMDESGEGQTPVRQVSYLETLGFTKKDIINGRNYPRRILGEPETNT